MAAVITPVDLTDIHNRLLSIEEKLTSIAKENSNVSVEGSGRLTRLETQMNQLILKDIPHLQLDVTNLKKTFSARRILLYSGGAATLIVSLVNIARMFRLLP